MFRTLKLLCGLLVVFMMTGCAHQVAFNTPATQSYSNKIPMRALFYMDSTSKNLVWSGRSAAAGIANKWVVPVGQTTNMYARSYLEDGFASFSETNTLRGDGQQDILIHLTNLSYYMASQKAHCSMDINVLNDQGRVVFRNNYSSQGGSQGGKVFFGGAMAQKSAIRQSTHGALETIFRNFINDAQANYRKW